MEFFDFTRELKVNDYDQLKPFGENKWGIKKRATVSQLSNIIIGLIRKDKDFEFF